MSVVNEPPSKRLRNDDGTSTTMVEYSSPGTPVNLRTSSLPEPTLKLSGHKGSVYGCSFDPSGESLVSAGFDMVALLWNASGGYENYNVLEGHKNAILDVKWHSDEYLVTASADKTLGWYHAYTGTRVKKLQGHTGIVNAVDTAPSTAPPLFVSASDDSTVLLWDARVRGPTGQMQDSDSDVLCPVTSVAYHHEAHQVFSGGIDNMIHVWDTRKLHKTMSLKGHTDTITCLSLHPKQTHILSNSMDGTLKSWDIRPFVSSKHKRLHKTFTGATHNAEKGLLKCAWSADGNMVTAGSADRMVHIWDELTAEELYLLPGHKGCVNVCVFHPKENVIASGSSDKTVYVGELST